jgi:hypothetical protein
VRRRGSMAHFPERDEGPRPYDAHETRAVAGESTDASYAPPKFHRLASESAAAYTNGTTSSLAFHSVPFRN